MPVSYNFGCKTIVTHANMQAMKSKSRNSGSQLQFVASGDLPKL